MKKILASLIFCCQFFCIGGMSPEKLIDEYRKSRNTSNLKKTQEFITQIKEQIIIPEIEKISVLGDMHDANIRRFLQLCGQEDNITEVRFINASTLITGLNIPQERKNYFLSMLNQEDRTETIIRELASSAYFIDEKDGFISCMDRMVRGKTKEQIREIQKNMRDYICSSVQDDIAFRTQILSHVTEGCENSKIYGDLIIALLASNEAPRNICRSLDTDSCYTRDKMTFIHSSENVGGYKAISFSEQVGYVRSFFHNASSIPLLNGFYGIELPPEMVIFHECGHALDFFNVILERMKLCRYLPDHILYKIIGKFIESILDDKAFASELDF